MLVLQIQIVLRLIDRRKRRTRSGMRMSALVISITAGTQIQRTYREQIPRPHHHKTYYTQKECVPSNVQVKDFLFGQWCSGVFAATPPRHWRESVHDATSMVGGTTVLLPSITSFEPLTPVTNRSYFAIHNVSSGMYHQHAALAQQQLTSSRVHLQALRPPPHALANRPSSPSRAPLPAPARTAHPDQAHRRQERREGGQCRVPTTGQ